MSDTDDVLTILHSVDNKFATKRFNRHPKTGKLRNRSYDKGYQFRVELRPVGSFAELTAALDALTRRPHAFVVRGAPLPDTNLHHTKRRFRPQGGEPATFTHAARRWLAVDMDHIPAPPLANPVTDPEGAIEHLIGLLPAEMHDASFWWQFTSSQSLPRDDGRPDNEHLSARLWFWGTVPLTDADLKRWAAHANQHGRVIDPALYHAIQAHYTCAPVFEDGLADPLPRRCGVRRGLEDEVSLIIPPADPKRPELASGEGWPVGRGVEAYLAEIGGGKGFHEPIKSAVASFVAIYGSKASAAELKRAIREAIDAADPGGRDQDTLDRYKSDQHLDDIIAAIRRFQGDKPGTAEDGDPPPGFDDPPPTEPDPEPRVEPDPEEIARVNTLYPLPAWISPRLEYYPRRSGEVWVHRIVERENKETKQREYVRIPVCSPFSVPAWLRLIDLENAYGVRVHVADRDTKARTVDFQRGDLARLRASEILSRLMEAGMRIANGGEAVIVEVLKETKPPRELATTGCCGWHCRTAFLTPEGQEIA